MSHELGAVKVGRCCISPHRVHTPNKNSDPAWGGNGRPPTLLLGPPGHLWRRLQSRGRPPGKGHLWALGTASFARPLPPKGCGRPRASLLAQGRVILAGSTFRREKMRLDPCTDRRPDAARASSRRLAGRHGRHWFLRRRELIVQLAVAHRSDQNIDDEGDLIERRDGDCVLALLELNRF